MIFCFIVGRYGYEFGFEIIVNRYDINTDSKCLFDFRIFTSGLVYPWFKYRWMVSRGILRFELGHGKLQSAWIAQGPLKKVA